MKAWLLVEIALARGKGPLLAACGLIVLVFAGAGWWIVQAQREEAFVKEQLAAAQLKSAGKSINGAVTSSDPERLAKFHAALGARANLDQHMRKVYDAARKRGLELDVGDYRLVTDTAGGFQRYQVQLPIDGPFSGIQSFSQQVLLDLSFAALEDIAFQRESIDAPIVEARLRFVLFLAADQPVPQRAAAPQAPSR